MKKLIYCAAALAAMIFAGSCQRENLEPVAQENTVTYTVELPGVETKAIADGSNVDKLVYEVWKINAEGRTDVTTDLTTVGTRLFQKTVDMRQDAGETSRAIVTLNLVQDQEYTILFWAHNSKAVNNAPAYNTADLTAVTYADDILSGKTTPANNESLAAFFAVDFVSEGDPRSKTVYLKRPFAQLNIGTLNTVASDEYTINMLTSKVTVSSVPNVFNVATSKASGELKDFVFDTDILPNNPAILPVGGTDYHYVAMNYIFANHLTDNGQSPATVEVNFDINVELDPTADGAANTDATVNHVVPNVPLSQNYRTNIVGNLLTSETKYEVIVDADFENPDYDLHMIYDVYHLQAALDAAIEAGNYTFYIGADLDGDVTITQREGVNIVIDGSKYPAEGGPKFDGTITINGNARSTGAETLTFKNLKFETKTAKTFIDAPTKIDNKYNYSHNVTVENCSFAAEAYNEEVVGIKLLTTYNAVIRNCSAKNIHSLAQFQSVDNATVIENVTVENCKNGISLGNMASATITGAKISAKGYGIRLDGEKSREVGVTITDSEISAYIPVNVRKMNNDDCKATVNLQGENTLAGATYEVAFCSNEYEEGVAPVSPKGTFTLDGAEKYDVYFGDSINTTSAFEAAINSNVDVIDVEAKIENVGIGFEVERDVVFNFNDEELNAGSTATSTWYALQIIGDYDVVINDANFTRAGVYAAEGADVLFNSGVINHKPERTSRYIFCAQSGSTITILDGTFNNDRQKNAYFWADNATIYVKGGTFGGVASNKKVVLSNGGKVIISGGTFNFDPTPYLAVGFSVEKVGSNWKVVAANNGDKLTIDGVEYTYADDATAFAAAIAESNAVALGEGTFTLPAISKDMTIKGSENTVITINKPNMSGSNLTLDGVTVKGSGYATGVQHVNTVTYKNATIVGEMCLYGEENTFEDCTFELNNQYIWVYGSKVAVFTGCTFNTNGKAILVYNEGAGANKVTVTGCTFNATAGAKAGAIANQNCAAIEIDNFQSSGVGVAHEVITSENTFANHFSGEWRIKNFVAGNAVTVNGTAYNQIAVDGKLMTIDASKNVTVIE